jgi:adenylate cyclase
MTAERAERRLMAVLAADVAGYSRLVGADEEGSLVQWSAHWHALIQIVPFSQGLRAIEYAAPGLSMSSKELGMLLAEHGCYLARGAPPGG